MVSDNKSLGALPRLVDINVLADHLGVAPRHVRRLVAERRIPYVKWGHLVRFDPVEVARWLETARVPGEGDRRSTRNART
jgi:excisionase family DNA binding protein